MWKPLIEKGYRRLFAGQILSDFAGWLDFIALSTLIVYIWGHGSLAVAALTLCMGLPWIALGPFISVRIQRFSGKNVLIVCDLLRAGVMLGLVYANSLLLLLLLVFLKSSVSAVFDPVRQSMIKRLVKPEQLAEASSLSQLSASVTKILGPAAGGAILAAMNAEACFWACATLYLLSAVVLAGLPRQSYTVSGRQDKESSVLRDSLQIIRRSPLLKASMMYAAFIFFLIFLFDGLFVVLGKEVGLSEDQFGIVISAVGAGSVAGALAAGRWSGWKARPLRRMTASGLGSGCMLVLFAAGALGWLPATMLLWLTICFVLGFCSAQGATPLGYILQAESTEETIGPVASLSNALQTSSMLIAPFIGALFAQWLGIGWVFACAGLLMLAVVASFRGKSALAGNPARVEV